MGYRVIELHDTDAALSRWFCHTCKQEAPQRGTYAPECPAKREHEASPKHLAALETKAAEAEQRREVKRPQNLLQQRVDARPGSAPGAGAARRAAKRAKQSHAEASAAPSAEELAMGASRAAELFLKHGPSMAPVAAPSPEELTALHAMYDTPADREFHAFLARCAVAMGGEPGNFAGETVSIALRTDTSVTARKVSILTHAAMQRDANTALSTLLFSSP